MIGQFHEISIRTDNIGESVAFYERLGFSHCVTNDTWSHPYGVLTDGVITLGLHQYKFPSPSITCVKYDIPAQLSVLESLGVEIAWRRLGDDVFNEFGFVDPAGQMVTLLEARTYSPSDRRRGDNSLLGDFAEFSIPATDFESMRVFWEKLGFIAHDEIEAPYVHMSITSDHVNIGAHRPRALDAPLLVFSAPDMPARLERLRQLDVAFSDELPRGLMRESNALLSAPEGTLLLLLDEHA